MASCNVLIVPLGNSFTCQHVYVIVFCVFVWETDPVEEGSVLIMYSSSTGEASLIEAVEGTFALYYVRFL